MSYWCSTQKLRVLLEIQAYKQENVLILSTASLADTGIEGDKCRGRSYNAELRCIGGKNAWCNVKNGREKKNEQRRTSKLNEEPPIPYYTATRFVGSKRVVIGRIKLERDMRNTQYTSRVYTNLPS